ncbi:MAG: ABC transporter ATP-binding protein [Planctomycetes bacterium]|nr:ABC transporter ATP-binding protein [Planctomycetota bacterium]
MSDGPVIDLRGVTVRYGRFVALDDVTATSEGGAVGLLGPNGAGKSSLIKALLGLVPLAEGEAKVLGDDVRRQPDRLRRRLGYMPERDAAFPHLTGFQATWYAGRLAGMPDADARRRAHEVLLFAGLEEARYRDVSTYSTGMRQRVKLAQALVHDPDLLFLDEPTNGLDPKGRDEMLALIKTLSRAKGIHVVLSSHLLRDVEDVCGSVLVMRHGKMVKHETIEGLRKATDDAFSVLLRGDGEAFKLACERRGMAVRPRKGTEVEVHVPRGTGARDVFGAALESGTVVHKLVPTRVSLEEALLDVLGRDD